MRIAALAFALAAAASWGVGGVLLKRGLDVVSPTTFLVFQYLLGIVLVGAWIVASGGVRGSVDAAAERWPALAAISLFQIGGYVCFIVAARYSGEGSIPTAAALGIAAAYPAVIAVLSAPILGQALRWNHAPATALLVGAVILAQL